MDFSHIDNIFPNNKVIEFYCGSLINHNSKRFLYKSYNMYIKDIKNIRQIQKWYRIQMHTKKSNIAHTFVDNVIKDSIRTITITSPNQAGNGDNIPYTPIHDPIETLYYNSSNTSLHDPIHTISTKLKEGSMFSYITDMLYSIKKRVIG